MAILQIVLEEVAKNRKDHSSFAGPLQYNDSDRFAEKFAQLGNLADWVLLDIGKAGNNKLLRCSRRMCRTG